MIYLFSGTPGSGKSLHQAECIFETLRSGSPVIANFPVNLDVVKGRRRASSLGEFYYIDNEILTPSLLLKYSKLYFKTHKFKEGAIRLFIDECQLLFNAREWNKKGRKEWLSFFTQHRKLGYDIILVCQFDKMLDRQLRSLIEYEYIHRKVQNYGTFGFLFSLFARGSLFSCVMVWYPLRVRTNHRFIIGKKRYFNMYNTLDIFNNDFGGS